MSYSINPEVIKSLKNGQRFYGDRRTGKSFSLLAYVAVFHAAAAPHSLEFPILVYPDVVMAKYMKRVWEQHFGNKNLPRFMSMRQSFKGLTGTIFTDEVDAYQRDKIIFFPHILRDGGGVRSS